MTIGNLIVIRNLLKILQMKDQTFIISYQALMTNGSIEIHTTKVHHCFTELHAMMKLKDYLKRKYPMFKSLAILSCKPQSPFESFGDMFGSNNPFK